MKKTPEQNKQPENTQPTIAISGQYIKDFSFEVPFAPAIFKEMTAQPQLQVDLHIDTAHLENNMHEVALTMKVNGEVNSKKMFILELTYAALVTLNVPEEHVEPVLNIEIPRLIFPFARSIISQTLTEGGLPPFMINPIDFAAIYMARKNAQKN